MPIRSHVNEASGTSEAWYVPPPVSIRLRPCLGKAQRAGAGRVRTTAFLNILRNGC
jgi:hypothetical protein